LSRASLGKMISIFSVKWHRKKTPTELTPPLGV
jgi:hypothetical protein